MSKQFSFELLTFILFRFLTGLVPPTKIAGIWVSTYTCTNVYTIDISNHKILWCANHHFFSGKYNSMFSQQASQYAYFHDEDESSFHLVDTARVQKPIYQRGRGRFNQVCSIFIMILHCENNSNLLKKILVFMWVSNLLTCLVRLFSAKASQRAWETSAAAS